MSSCDEELLEQVETVAIKTGIIKSRLNLIPNSHFLLVPRSTVDCNILRSPRATKLNVIPNCSTHLSSFLSNRKRRLLILLNDPFINLVLK